MTSCVTCKLVARRDNGEAPLWDNILRTSNWDLAHSFNTSLPGWLVLVTRRHVSAVAELSEDEAVELGSLLRRVSQALQQATGCSKTYVVQFAEHPDHPHVHFHVIPRRPDLPVSLRGPRIFDLVGIAPEERLSETEMDALAARIREALDTR